MALRLTERVAKWRVFSFLTTVAGIMAQCRGCNRKRRDKGIDWADEKGIVPG